MFRFGLHNLRRLRDVPITEIKPITLLVGRNSSGKSTFLRSFPLIRQSLMTRIRSPILWYGESVDFGSFEGSVFMNDTTLPISFKFGLDDIGLIDTRPSYYRSPVQINIGSVDFEIEIVSTHDTSRIDEIKIHIIDTGDVIVLRPNETDQINSVVINGRESKALFSTYRLSVTPGSLLPEIIIIQNPNNDRVNRQYLVNPGNILEEEFSAIVNLIVPKKIARSNVKSLAHSLAEQWPITRESIADCIRNLELSSLDRLADSFEEGGRTDIFERLHTASIANIIPRLMTALSRSTTTIISDTMYIGPARARSERYYRYQDLSVSEIDADGKAFPCSCTH